MVTNLRCQMVGRPTSAVPTDKETSILHAPGVKTSECPFPTRRQPALVSGRNFELDSLTTTHPHPPTPQLGAE